MSKRPRVLDEEAESVPADVEFDPDCYGTPERLVKWMLTMWIIIGDAAASAKNAIVPWFIDKETNALVQNWFTFFSASLHLSNGMIPYVFCNPPYSKMKNGESRLKIWTAKCLAEAERGVGVLLLVPVPQGQKGLWGKLVFGKASIIYQVEGRLAFRDPVTREPCKHTNFGSWLIVYDPVNLRKSQKSNVPFDTIIKELYI